MDAMEKIYPQLVVMPYETLKQIEARLETIEKMLDGRIKEEEKSKWIESVEARKMLGVSQKTWQTYRDERVIPFSQFGRKIYVKKADLEAFLEKNKKENIYERKA